MSAKRIYLILQISKYNNILSFLINNWLCFPVNYYSSSNFGSADVIFQNIQFF